MEVHVEAISTVASLLLVIVPFLTVLCLRCRQYIRRPRQLASRTNPASEFEHNVKEGVPSFSSLSQGDSTCEDETVPLSHRSSQVNMKPGRPRALRVTFDCIELEWTKPAQNVSTYTICYRSTADQTNHWVEEGCVSAITVIKGADRAQRHERVLVMQLLEKTTYYFKVRSEYAAGNGFESDISEPIKTKGIVPSHPGKPSCSSVSHNSIHLEWTKPEQGAHNIIAYRIFYRSQDDLLNQWIMLRVKSAEESVTVPHLSERTVYFFKAQSECDDSFGLESDISEPITTMMIIPGKPGKHKAIDVTHDSIQLQWSKPEQGAHNVISYTLLYHLTSMPSDHWIEVAMKSTVETLILSELLEYTFHYFKVRPECEVGVGVESEISDPIQTKMIIPSKPGKPKATNVAHDSVQLEWTKPEQGVHNIISYTVLYRSANDPPDMWSEHKVATEVEVLLPQLSENTLYYFKLRPDCKVGSGLESDISDPVQTKVIIPSKPGKPKALSITYNSVQLKWAKPRDGSHNITSYVILYRSTSDPPDQWIKFETKCAEKIATVPNLQHDTNYHFKVQPKYDSGVGDESDISESIKTEEVPLFNKVIHKLWNARGKWYNTGLSLGLDETDLDIIKEDNQYSTDSCFTRMLSLWFKQVQGSWQMLIDALSDKTVGFQELANSISDEIVSQSESITVNEAQNGKGFDCPLCGTCTLDKYLKQECPKFYSSSDSAFPFLDTFKLTEDEKFILHARLIEETDNVNQKFNNLVYLLTESLSAMTTDKLKNVANQVCKISAVNNRPFIKS